jgi:ribosome biogenesis protein Nip4
MNKPEMTQEPNKNLYRQISTKINDTINDTINKTVKNQDFMQRFFVINNFFMEIYRVVTSSLLIVFVPQLCDNHVCSIVENISWSNNELYNVGLVFNYSTLFIFLCLYIIEIRRENRLIKYLNVNIHMPNGNEDIEKTLDLIPISKKNKILTIDKQYQIVSYITMIIFTLNVILSGIIVNQNYLNNQTEITLITYILFMITKLYNVYIIANTEKNIFYSAYLRTNVQFNDLDDKYKQNIGIVLSN